MFGSFGAPEIILISVLILLIFGGKKIPEMMRGLGTGMKEFKKATSGDDEEPRKTPERVEEPKRDDAPARESDYRPEARRIEEHRIEQRRIEERGDDRQSEQRRVEHPRD
jgi:sec-independent protein translocase protein TatA